VATPSGAKEAKSKATFPISDLRKKKESVYRKEPIEKLVAISFNQR
jgi:hypothetical protein